MDERMITLEEALSILDQRVAAKPRTVERIPAREACGRVLAETVVSKFDIPPFNKSAVDGYAISEPPVLGNYRLMGCVRAGQLPERALSPGEALKVMTGAPLPEGADRIVMLEDVVVQDGYIEVQSQNSSRNICIKGEDLLEGGIVLEAGRTLDAAGIANMVGCGVEDVAVSRPVTLAIISTGDELLDDSTKIAPGKIIDSNRPLIKMLASEHGLEVTFEASVGDKPSLIFRILRDAVEAADIAVISGGVSVGDYDFVPKALIELGFQIYFNRIAVKPGKPTTFAKSERGIVLGLPGNPVAVYIMFHLMVLRAAARLARARYAIPARAMTLAADFSRKTTARAEFAPVAVARDGRVAPVEFHGSAHLAALDNADGFILVPIGVDHIKAGAQVEFIDFKSRWC